MQMAVAKREQRQMGIEREREWERQRERHINNCVVNMEEFQIEYKRGTVDKTELNISKLKFLA